jgi:hypothetical protein
MAQPPSVRQQKQDRRQKHKTIPWDRLRVIQMARYQENRPFGSTQLRQAWLAGHKWQQSWANRGRGAIVEGAHAQLHTTCSS